MSKKSKRGGRRGRALPPDTASKILPKLQKGGPHKGGKTKRPDDVLDVHWEEELNQDPGEAGSSDD